MDQQPPANNHPKAEESGEEAQDENPLPPPTPPRTALQADTPTSAESLIANLRSLDLSSMMFGNRTRSSSTASSTIQSPVIASARASISAYIADRLPSMPSMSPIAESSDAPLSTNTNTSGGGDRDKERRSLYMAFTVCLRSLVDMYAGTGKSCHEGDPWLERFCCVAEHVLAHGFRSRKAWRRRDVWDFVEASLESIGSQASILRLATVRDMEGVKSAAGRLRAWTRLSLMDRSFAATWLILVDPNQSELSRLRLEDFYEDWALIRSELVVAMSGLLLGLESSVEFNIFIKGDALESLSSNIDWGVLLAMDDPSVSPGGVAVGASVLSPQSEDAELLAISAEQKLYLESQNKQLVEKVDLLTRTVSHLQADLAEKSRRLNSLQAELAATQRRCSQLAAEKSGLLDKYAFERDSMLRDFALERQTFQEHLVKLQAAEAKLKSQSAEPARLQAALDEALRDRVASDMEKERTINILKATQARLVMAIKAKDRLQIDVAERDAVISSLSPATPSAGADDTPPAVPPRI